jgi:dihydrofolate reductase
MVRVAPRLAACGLSWWWRTSRWAASCRPPAGPNLFTEILRTTRKYVVSRTLTEPLSHPASTLVSGDAVDAVRALKADGELVVLGSGDLVRQPAAGLVDRAPA